MCWFHTERQCGVSTMFFNVMLCYSGQCPWPLLSRTSPGDEHQHPSDYSTIILRSPNPSAKRDDYGQSMRLLQ